MLTRLMNIPLVKKCDQCEFYTTNYNAMSTHIKRIHSKERLICSDCGFTTIFKDSFKKHQINKYIKEKRCRSEEIRCKFCNTVGTTGKLTLHMKIEHPKERLFECDKCSYISNWMNNLRMHKNGKHEETKLVCNQCKFESFWGPELSYHKRTVHETFRNKFKSKPFHKNLCDLCGFQPKSDIYNYTENPPLKFIYGDIMNQKEAIKAFLLIDKKRKYLKENILPGDDARTRANTAPNTSA